MKTRLTTALALVLLTIGLVSTATAQRTSDPSRWEEAIARFDADAPSRPKGAIVLTGSSSFARWRTMEADLAPLTVVPRGFGGSTMADVLQYVDRLVKPYQPPRYWDHLNFPKRTYEADEGDDQYRRGLYTHWQRSFLHPSLAAFDAPSREECVAERPVSNTPQQALTLLNDPTYVEAARVFAYRIWREGGSTNEARVRWALRQALSRHPSDEETKVLADLFEAHLDDFSRDPDAARALLGVGLAPIPDDLEAPELAAWTSVARAISSLHETLTRS